MTDLVKQLVGALEGLMALEEENHQRYPGDEDVCKEVLDARAALTAAKAGGWVAVPVEPTDEMLAAGKKQAHSNNSVGAKCLRIYAAILALRPAQQAVPMTDAWQEVAACPDGDVWFSLSCGHVVMGWKHGDMLDWEAMIDHDCCSDAHAVKAQPVVTPNPPKEQA